MPIVCALMQAVVQFIAVLLTTNDQLVYVSPMKQEHKHSLQPPERLWPQTQTEVIYLKSPAISGFNNNSCSTTKSKPP